MKLLLVTHSSRPFQEERSSLNFLEKRFSSPDRLERLPAVEAFLGVEVAVPFQGALSIWRWDESTGRLSALGAYRPDYKVQFAEIVGDWIVVLGSDRLEVLSASLDFIKVISHPHLVGAHTVFKIKGSKVWVTTAPGNAVLQIDIESGEVILELSMPSRYGQGYLLSPELNLGKHYIPTDYQPTHINCAFPCENGVLVTLWIPGAVGLFDHNGSYREIVKGFRGCHGGRMSSRGEMYFSDSAAGIVWFIDVETGQVKSRYKVNSRWVHDCAQLSGDFYVCTLSDDNKLFVFSRKTQTQITSVELDQFGASAMFVNVVDVSAEMVRRLMSASKLKKGGQRSVAGPDVIPPVTDSRFWTWYSAPMESVKVRYERKAGSLALQSDGELVFEVLLRSSEIVLEPGSYRLLFGANCDQGQLEASIEVGSKHICSVQVSHVHSDGVVDFLVNKTTKCFLVVAAANSEERGFVSAAVRYATIQILNAEGSVMIAPRKSVYLKSIFSPGDSY